MPKEDSENAKNLYQYYFTPIQNDQERIQIYRWLFTIIKDPLIQSVMDKTNSWEQFETWARNERARLIGEKLMNFSLIKNGIN